MKRTVFLTFAILLVIFIACSKDKDNPTEPTTEEAPQLVIQSLDVPSSLLTSSDPHARTIVTYVQMANMFTTSMSGFIAPPEWAGPATRTGRLWEYTWNQDALQIMMHITENDDNFSWVTQFHGQDANYTYNNWIAYRAVQAKDGKSGTLTMYLPNTTTVLGEYSWQMDQNGAIHFEVKATGITEGKVFKGVSHPDKSGELEIYEIVNGQEVLVEKFKWNADGSGQWWTFENGEEKDSGSWN